MLIIRQEKFSKKVLSHSLYTELTNDWASKGRDKTLSLLKNWDTQLLLVLRDYIVVPRKDETLSQIIEEALCGRELAN